MKSSNKLSIFIVLILLVGTGCKKKTDNTIPAINNSVNPLNQQFGGGPVIPSTASGALYGINMVIDDNLYGNGQMTEGLAFAWFGSYITTKDAGTVKCDTSTLTTTIFTTSYHYPWYMIDITQGYLDFSGGNAINWSVTGNSSTGVAGFNYTDNMAWPTINGYNLNTTIPLGHNLTINFSTGVPNDGLIFTLAPYGGNSKVSKSAAAGTTTVTFTSSELAQLGTSGTAIAVQIMPFKYTTATVGGGTYYFVKETPYTQYAQLQ